MRSFRFCNLIPKTIRSYNKVFHIWCQSECLRVKFTQSLILRDAVRTPCTLQPPSWSSAYPPCITKGKLHTKSRETRDVSSISFYIQVMVPYPLLFSSHPPFQLYDLLWGLWWLHFYINSSTVSQIWNYNLISFN